MQSRFVFPGWYGLGSALEQFAAKGDTEAELLRTMYKEWMFFKATIDNAQLTLLKADMQIAFHYALLVPDEKIRVRIFDIIAEEFSRTEHAILAITGQKSAAGTRAGPREIGATPQSLHRSAQLHPGRNDQAPPRPRRQNWRRSQRPPRRHRTNDQRRQCWPEEHRLTVRTALRAVRRIYRRRCPKKVAGAGPCAGAARPGRLKFTH